MTLAHDRPTQPHPLDRTLERMSGLALGQATALFHEAATKLSRRRRQASSQQADVDQQVIELLNTLNRVITEEAWRRDTLAAQAKVDAK